MTELVDRVIAALRTEHDALEVLLPNLSDDQLVVASGASEWTIAQVLSHLGSGAEISRKPIARAVGEPFEEEDNQSVWARWDDSAPIDQAAGFVRHDRAYLETIEALSPEQRSSLSVDLGFLPEPVPVLVALGMRLNEVANHSWDVRVGLDPSSEIYPESADVLVELFAGPLAFILGFSAKPDQLAEEARVAGPGVGLVIGDAVTVTGGDLDRPTAKLIGSPEAFIRLLNGRLKAPYDEGVAVEGDVSLDDLRRVFPGA